MEQDDLKQSAKPRKKKSATTADTVSWTKKRTRKKSVSTKTTKKTQENIVNEIALSATPDPLLVESTTQDLWIQNINDYITTMKQRRSDTPLQHTSNIRTSDIHISPDINLACAEYANISEAPWAVAIVPHKQWDHKIVYLRSQMPDVLIPDPKWRQKWQPYKKWINTIYDVHVDMYEHPWIHDMHWNPLSVWVVDDISDVYKQYDAIRAWQWSGQQFADPIILQQYWGDTVVNDTESTSPDESTIVMEDVGIDDTTGVEIAIDSALPSVEDDIWLNDDELTTDAIEIDDTLLSTDIDGDTISPTNAYTTWDELTDSASENTTINGFDISLNDEPPITDIQLNESSIDNQWTQDSGISPIFQDSGSVDTVEMHGDQDNSTIDWFSLDGIDVWLSTQDAWTSDWSIINQEESQDNNEESSWFDIDMLDTSSSTIEKTIVADDVLPPSNTELPWADAIDISMLITPQIVINEPPNNQFDLLDVSWDIQPDLQISSQSSHEQDDTISTVWSMWTQWWDLDIVWHDVIEISTPEKSPDTWDQTSTTSHEIVTDTIVLWATPPQESLEQYQDTSAIPVLDLDHATDLQQLLTNSWVDAQWLSSFDARSSKPVSSAKWRKILIVIFKWVLPVLIVLWAYGLFKLMFSANEFVQSDPIPIDDSRQWPKEDPFEDLTWSIDVSTGWVVSWSVDPLPIEDTTPPVSVEMKLLDHQKTLDMYRTKINEHLALINEFDDPAWYRLATITLEKIYHTVAKTKEDVLFLSLEEIEDDIQKIETLLLRMNIK
jgi:hypothetical protein